MQNKQTTPLWEGLCPSLLHGMERIGCFMIIQGGAVYCADRVFRQMDVFIRDGRFAHQTPDKKTVNAHGCYVIPGLVDMHLHGCMGYDVCDGTYEAIAQIAAYEASAGVAAMALATMTLPVPTLNHILSVAAAYRQNPAQGADLVGINMEGPFISENKKGAQDARHLLPCHAGIAKEFCHAAQGLVKVIGLAPEVNPAFAGFIRQMKDSVHISLAHTNADYDTAIAAFAAGADHVTHLYNAMPPFLHRQPGVIGATTDCPQVSAELICDGIHVHPAAVRAAFRLFGAERLIFVSDSMRAAGMPDGVYSLGGLNVQVMGRRATSAGGSALAGSVTHLLDCLRIAVLDMGIPLTDAIACATINPARVLGIAGEYGTIAVGKRANVLLLDQNLHLKAVIKDGVQIK